MALSPIQSTSPFCFSAQKHSAGFCVWALMLAAVISPNSTCGASPIVLANSLNNEVDVKRAELLGDPTQNGTWIVDPDSLSEGQKKPLCRSLLSHLNGYRGCALFNFSGVMATFHKFSEPPWQELDPKKYVDLIWRLMMYTQGGPDRYFHRVPGLPPIIDNGDRRLALDFINRGGKLRIWHARIFNYYLYDVPAPPGKQTIVGLYEPFKIKNENACVKPALSEFGSTYITTSDLGGPDPAVDPGTAAILQSGELLFYEGRLYLVTIYGTVYDMREAAHLPFWAIPDCTFQFQQGDR